MTQPADTFTAHRGTLFGVAYRMLGSVAEAEDMVQETFLRWRQQSAAAITTPKAWLIATMTRLCIDQLRLARRRREEYVGVWLPEPLVDPNVPAPDATAAMADSLGVAFLLMLEQLGPVERAVFLLREAFELEYAEIATIVAKSEANCRQLFSRARAQLARSEVSEAKPPTERATQIVQRFLTACTTGDMQGLLSVLTDDAVLYGDGGGRVKAAPAPIHTANEISRFFVSIREPAFAGAEFSLVSVNGSIGILNRGRNGDVTVTTFAFAGDRIRAIYAVRNPEKLRHVRLPN